MPFKIGVTAATAPALPNRCRCGHFPTAHMVVQPADALGGASFRLVPAGPCAVCGEVGCRKYAPVELSPA